MGVASGEMAMCVGGVRIILDRDEQPRRLVESPAEEMRLPMTQNPSLLEHAGLY
jgi:hypothetical protein